MLSAISRAWFSPTIRGDGAARTLNTNGYAFLPRAGGDRSVAGAIEKKHRPDGTDEARRLTASASPSLHQGVQMGHPYGSERHDRPDRAKWRRRATRSPRPLAALRR